jgi:hypothetical protein
MAVRYSAYSLVGAEILLLPTLLSRSAYGELEYYRYLIGLSSMLLLGSHTGYLYSLYSSKKDSYPTLFAAGGVILVAGAAVLGGVAGRAVAIPAVACFGLSVILEKRLQAAKDFYVAILYRPLVSLAILGIAAAISARGLTEDGAVIASAGFCLALAAWIAAAARFSSLSLRVLLPVGWPAGAWTEYGRLVRQGVVENLATILLTAFLFADRYFIRASMPAALASFSFAFNLAQLVSVGLNSIGYVAAVNYGEEFGTIAAAQVRRALLRTLAVFGVLAGGTLAVAFVYGYLIVPDVNLVPAVALTLIGSGTYFTVGTASSLILYGNLQWKSTVATAIAVVLCFASGWLMSAVGCHWLLLLAKSAALLVILAAYNLSLVFEVLRRSNVQPA